jgi:signal transduction histidine kinase
VGRERPWRVLLVAVVAGGLGLTAAVTGILVAQARDDARARTLTELRAVGAAVDRQVSSYAETLFVLRAALALRPGMSRAEFATLVDVEALTRRNPGARAISFDRRVAAADLVAFEAARRRELPGFAVHPRDGTPADHYVIDYVQPREGNEAALGYDVASEPRRLQAVEFARDEAELAATGPLALVQGTRPGDGPGFLLMLAAYDTAPPPVTGPARRRHVMGVVVAAFEARDMLTNALELPSSLQLTVYDAGVTTDEPHGPRPQDWLVGQPRETTGPYTDVDVGDRRWRLQAVRPLAPYRSAPVSAALSGVALTALVCGVLLSVAGSRRRALALAATMTESLRESEERLRTANASLVEADRVKDEFLGNVSHELRTPLTAIAGISDLLNRRSDRLSADQVRDLLHRLAGNVRTLRGLIDDLLDFTRLTTEDGRVVAPVDLQAVATTVVRQLGTLLADHHVVVLDGPPAVALANEQDVGRVLHNLLANAVKYTPEGSHVVISTSVDAYGVQLLVADDGPGIPAADAERVFERFQRGSGDDVLRQPGTGIGLAVVRELCQRLGGDVTLRPTPGGGATFAVRLPLVPDS